MRHWVCLLSLMIVGAANAEDHPYRVMLLTGQNNHNWKATTPKLENVLRETGHFAVTTVTTPPAGASAEAWRACPLNFSNYQAVVMNWNDFGVNYPTNQTLPMPWMDELVRYVQNGGGLVIVHAASLEHHPLWSEIVGLGWHNAAFGDHLTVDDRGQVVRTPAGKGPSSGHGVPFEWNVVLCDTNHPICRGMAPVWHHLRDELWHGTRGPARNLDVLATAFSPITKANEPVMWTVHAGQGRVFVTLLGHEPGAIDCPGFRQTLTQGCQWTIGGGDR